MKISLKNVKYHIRLKLTRTGSLLRETIQAGGRVETSLHVEADEAQDFEKIKLVLRNARTGCWARQLVEKSAVFEDTVSLNGQTIDLFTKVR